MLYTDGTGRFYRGDLQPGDREATPEEVTAYDLARTDNQAKWNARAQEKARVTINQARQAVANMIAKRTEADPTTASLRTLHAQLLALIPSTSLATSTHETTAYKTLWDAYTLLVVAFPSPIRAEYKLEFELLTKALA